MADSAADNWSSSVGDHVRVRRERWQVTAVDGGGSCRLLTLAGLGPSNTSEVRQFLEPFEDVELAAGVQRTATSEPRRGFAGPARERRCGRARWRSMCRSMLARRGTWPSVHTADTARIEPLPHQIELVRAVLSGGASRVLIADAVGLGKTVQAGLLLGELLRRGAIESALVLTPAGLRDQWHHELRDRFAIESTVVDLRTAARQAMESPVGVGPWTALRLAITSVDYIKRLEVLPAARARMWDLVIVDEAHLIAPGTDRHHATAALCALSLYVILLTATPHSGDRAAYDALCALGEQGDRCLRFQRTRLDVQLPGSRRVHQLRVRPTAAERRMHAALDRYGAAVRAECGDAGHAMLLLSMLWKRALSSPESLRRSVARRLSTLDSGALIEDTQLRLPLDDGDGEFDVDDEAPAIDGAVLSDGGRERRLLERLEQAAAQACAGESKLHRLARLLARLRRQGETAIVFTEYRDTLMHVQYTVAPDAVVLHGGLTRRERAGAIEAFTSGAARTLLATDAAGEGLNLQANCRCVIHLEVPWNPVRLEQRTGRVDRIGQARTVHAFHLVARQRVEHNLLERLRARVASAQQDVVMASPLESQRAVAAGEAIVTRAVDAAASAPESGEPSHGNGLDDEIARITLARALARVEGPSAVTSIDGSHDVLTAGDGPVARRRRSRAHWASGALFVLRARARRRAALRGDVLLLVDAVARDALGRRVAARVVALRMNGRIWRARQPGGVAAVATTVAAAIERDGGDASGRAARQAFWMAAQRRADAIAQAVAPRPEEIFQPGLFDRRADRRRDLLAAEQHALAEAAARRAARVAAMRADGSLEVGRWLVLEC